VTDRIDSRVRVRALKVGAPLLLAFLVLIGRLFQMQVLVSEEYALRAEENRVRPERIVALRGRIFDRNGTVLADSRPSFRVSVVPYLMRKDGAVLDRLGSLIGVPRELLAERAEEGASRPYAPTPVVRDVDITTVSLIEEHGYLLPGVFVESEPVRLYPRAALAAHTIGYVGEVTQEEIDHSEDGGYAVGTRVGRGGIERAYDAKLRGRDGVRYIQEDARGRPLGTLRETEPVPGEDLVLSLDADLQEHAESLLAAEGAGALVVIDPRSGEVLALASWPTVDPNILSVSIPVALWDSLTSDSLHPLIHRAIQATFPPGSTFKPITAATGLTEGIVDPGTRLLPCFGSYRFGRRVFHCWEEEGHGSLTLVPAMARSCDVYFYQIGAKMDLDRFAQIARGFGFGRPAGIDLPGEKGGLVPSMEYMNRRYGRSGWGRGHLLNHSIGQGEILANPLQIAQLYGALGTGKLARPHLLIQSVDLGGNRTEFGSGGSEPLPIPPEVLRPIREGLVAVVQGERGTGRAARVPGTAVAGKTGTAENPHGEDHAWFAAWAPAEDPHIALAVIVENAGHGGEIAAPMAGSLLRYIFTRGGV